MSAPPAPDIELVDVPRSPSPVLLIKPVSIPVQQSALELPLFHEPVERRKRWWATFSVSKVGQYHPFRQPSLPNLTSNHDPDHVFPNLEPTPDGFFLGSLSDKDFCGCVKGAPSRVGNAIVVRVMWWQARRTPLHHQFIVLTVSHSKARGELPVLYDLRVERVGKGIGFRGLAEHKITSTLAQPLEAYTATNDLMFGLLAEDIFAANPTAKGSFCTEKAFLDVLDDKWRGPPPTLWHTARYIESIVLLAPRYRLASTNCYYFSRLLMYAIGLRHYSFSTLAAGERVHLIIRSRRHDPSGISMLFRFLRKEEKSNGVLLYARIRVFVNVVSIFLLVSGCGVAVFFVWRHSRSAGLGVITMVGVEVLAVTIYTGLIEAVDSGIIEPSRNALRKEVEALVAKLDSDITLTAPGGRRGDYKLPYYLVPKTRTESRRTRGRDAARHPPVEVTYMGEKPGPRDPLPPWNNPEQIYPPHDVPAPVSSTLGVADGNGVRPNYKTVRDLVGAEGSV